MKRTAGIHFLISLVLLVAEPVLLLEGVKDENVFYIFLGISAFIAAVLNNACGYDKKDK